MLGKLPVIIAAGAPDDLTLPASRGSEGGFPIPAVFQIRFTIQRIKDADGLLNQAFRVEAPAPIVGTGRYRSGPGAQAFPGAGQQLK